MTTITGKPAGAKAGNQYGTFKVHYCSPAQARFIARLLDERVHDFKITDATRVNKKHASRIIDQLLKCPKKIIDPVSEKQLSYLDLLIKTRANADQYTDLFLQAENKSAIFSLDRDQAKNLIDQLVRLPKNQKSEVDLEVGAYLHDGIVYSVRKNSGSGRLHAFSFNADRKQWVFVRDMVYKITQEERLTLAQAMQFGASTGYCVHCGRTLTVQKSVVAGMGRVCATKYK
jgi:hypothetical protein